MYNCQRWESFEHPSSTPVVDRHMRWQTFCMKFNFEQLFFKAFFDAMRIFGGVEPQTECTSPFLYVIIFQRWNLSTSLAPLRGKIDTCAGRLFYTKFNFKQLLFETFLDATCIFCGLELQTESTFPFWTLVHICMSAHSRVRLRYCLFRFMAWYVSINIGGYGSVDSGTLVLLVFLKKVSSNLDFQENFRNISRNIWAFLASTSQHCTTIPLPATPPPQVITY